jgi:hypothetical protein
VIERELTGEAHQIVQEVEQEKQWQWGWGANLSLGPRLVG